MSVSCITFADAFPGRNNIIMFVIAVYIGGGYTTGNKKFRPKVRVVNTKRLVRPHDPWKIIFLMMLMIYKITIGRWRVGGWNGDANILGVALVYRIRGRKTAHTRWAA